MQNSELHFSILYRFTTQMITEIKDNRWNTIYQKDKSIYLHLKDKWETRKLWAISPKGELFIRRFNKHIFRKLDAYGFNYNLLKMLNPDMKVVVKEEDWTELHTTVMEILQKGNAKQFIQEWFELQIFLPRTLFSKK